MKKTAIIIICVIISFITNSQTVSFEWAKQIGGTNSELSKSIKVDALGNVYSVGYFQGTVDFDPASGTSFTLTSNGSADIFISKLDGLGNFVWAKQIGGTFYDEAKSLALDASGNLYISGIFNNTVDFDPNIGVVNLTTVGSSIDAFVIKLSSTGNLVWAKKFGGSLDEGAYSIALDISGNVFTTGYFQGTCDFDPSASTANLVGFSTNDNVFTCKLSSSGAYVWAKLIGGSIENLGTSIETDALGNVYTAGYFSGTSDFDPSVTVFNMTSNGLKDVFISKLDPSGNFNWAKNFGGTGDEFLNGISIDASNSIYSIGLFSNTVDFDPSALTTFTLSSFGGSDVFVNKLDQSGNFIFAKTFGGSSTDRGSAIKVDALGNIYCSGSFQNSTDFDPSISTFSLTSLGVDDAFILKLNTSGNLDWVKQIGGLNSQLAYGIDVDLSNSVYSVGVFFGNTDFNMASTSFSISSFVGSSDVFIHKMSICSVPLSPVNTSLPANQTICNGQSTILSATSTGTVNWYASPTGTIILSSGSTYTTPTLSAGTYTYYADAFTCTESVSRTVITVTVNPSPTFTVNSGSICSGSNFTLSPTGASTYTYSSGSTIVSPLSNTSYTVIGISSLGCTNTAVSNVTVSPILVPSISISTPSITLCGSSATFSSSIINGGSSPTYQWKKNGTSVGSGISSYSSTSLINGDVISCILNSNATCASPSVITSNSIIITVGTTPTITVNSGSICSGSNFTISPTGASTYTYSSGSTIVSPFSNTSYTVIGSSSLGCTNTAVSSVTVNALPIIGITTTNSLICTGQTVSLTASGAITYLWNTASTNSVLTVFPITTTNYTVTGIDLNGCSNIAVLTQSVSTCTDLAFLNTNNYNVKIYPNPSSGIFILSGIDFDSKINIYNGFGELVKSFLSFDTIATIDLSYYSNGIYFIKISNHKQEILLKLIKQ